MNRLKTGNYSEDISLQLAYTQGRLDEKCITILKEYCQIESKEKVAEMFVTLANAMNKGDVETIEKFLKDGLNKQQNRPML